MKTAQSNQYADSYGYSRKDITVQAMYVTMLKIRKFEERVAELVSKNEIICPCHLYIGEEAVATGVCSALKRDDYVFSTHRSHGHYIAKGGDIKALMAELYDMAGQQAAQKVEVVPCTLHRLIWDYLVVVLSLRERYL